MNSNGDFLEDFHGEKHYLTTLRSLLSRSKSISVASVIKSQLRQVQETVIREQSVFHLNKLSEREKNRRMLYLFQLDLMPGIAGEILDMQQSREFDKVNGVSRSAKLLGWICIIGLNALMLFYIFLFAVSQDEHKQKAWEKSFVIWLCMEIFVISSLMVFAIHVALPIMFMRDVNIVKMKLLESLNTYQERIHSDRDLYKDLSQCKDMSQFNAASFLYVSWKLAALHAHLRVSKIILQYRTPWPRQSLRRVRSLSSDYDSKFASLYSAVITVSMFFLTSFVVSPPVLQDIFVNMIGATAIGFVVFLHTWLYKVYPILVVVPALLIVGMCYVFLHQRSKSLIVPFSNRFNHKNSEKNVELLQERFAADSKASVDKISNQSDQIRANHHESKEEVFVDRRRSLMMGVDLAHQAIEELNDANSNSDSTDFDDLVTSSSSNYNDKYNDSDNNNSNNNLFEVQSSSRFRESIEGNNSSNTFHSYPASISFSSASFDSYSD